MVEAETWPASSCVILPFTLSSASYNFKCTFKKNTTTAPNQSTKSSYMSRCIKHCFKITMVTPN